MLFVSFAILYYLNLSVAVHPYTTLCTCIVLCRGGLQHFALRTLSPPRSFECPCRHGSWRHETRKWSRRRFPRGCDDRSELHTYDVRNNVRSWQQRRYAGRYWRHSLILRNVPSCRQCRQRTKRYLRRRKLCPQGSLYRSTPSRRSTCHRRRWSMRRRLRRD